MRNYIFWSVLGILIAVGAVAGTNTLPVETSRTVQLQHVNKFATALSGDVVPRNSSGVATDVGANNGTSVYRWLDVVTKKIDLVFTSGNNAISIQAPASVPSAYTVTLPSALPATNGIPVIDSTGAMSFGLAGVIFPYAGSSAPTGFLLCDGTSYLRATYPQLWSIVGCNYGCADGTHFNVPDFRGKFLRGVDGGAANDPDRASRTACMTGGNTGDNVGSCEDQATRKNGLALTDPGHSHTYTLPSAGSSQGGNDNSYFRLSSTANTSTSTTGITLGNGDNETRPKNVSVNYIIKF